MNKGGKGGDKGRYNGDTNTTHATTNTKTTRETHMHVGIANRRGNVREGEGKGSVGFRER